MLTKQAIDISFAQGLDTKTDPKRVSIGKFLKLENTVFNKGNLLQKRNGFANIATLHDKTFTLLTTFNENLIAIGQNVSALNTGNSQFIQKGNIQPLQLTTTSLIKNNLNQTACDAVTAPNGLVCAVYLENNAGTITNKYAIFNSATGQNVVSPSIIPVSSGSVSGGMRVFYLGTNFIIVFTNTITGTHHLQYVSVNSNTPTVVGTNTDLSSSYVPVSTLSWDGFVAGNKLYIAYNTTAGGQAINVVYLTTSFILSAAASLASYKATIVSVTADVTNSSNIVIYVSYFRSDTSLGYTAAFNQNLNVLLTPTQIISSGSAVNITSSAQNGVCYIAYELANNYSFAPGTGTPTNYIDAVNITLSGTVSSTTTLVRSVGLASKSFIINGTMYLLAAYSSSYQPTYFLINFSQSLSSYPVIAAKLAYSNGGGYLTTGLPSVTVEGINAQIPYLFKDLLQAVNKNTNVPSGTQTAGIFSQTGINLVNFSIGSQGIDSVEIGNDLYISGGFLWMYDGYLPVEQNFFLWPDVAPTSPPDPVNIPVATWSASGGSMVAQPASATNTDAYYYQFTYEWSDNQGNIFRSAPSIPIALTTTGSGTTGSVVLNIPTLRLTTKVSNPVKIVIYRWSVGQQIYYQTTDIIAPLLNDTTVDSVTFTDVNSDATILGNNIIYTNGGVVEDVNAPSSSIMTIFDTRLWLVDAENPDNLWFSKQVIPGTSVQMSDLFTLFISPTTSTQQSTGPVKSLSPLGDKIVIGKQNALLYINGSGPDNTGSNNQYSQPVFITSTVGCSNQQSMILTPNGLMFQSNKGIWMLDHGLNVTYVGAPVEAFTLGAVVTSAVNVPETNQVRFVLDTGVTLMYDYYYDQWGTFIGIHNISSCIYRNMHTFINAQGETFQETLGSYLDGGNPVLMAFKTGPINLGALQYYQRAYFFYLLGTYLTPFKANLNIFYDYSDSSFENHLISPINYSTPFGSGPSQSPYGQGNPYGGPSNLFNWRVFLQRQRCMAFAIEFQEIFDSTLGAAPGAGLTLSGINAIIGFKRAFRPQDTQTSVG